MVTEPEPTVLATEEPETMPSIALATTATFAGPPEKPPTTELEILMKKSAMPVLSKNAPKIMKIAMYLEHVLMGVERPSRDGIRALRFRTCRFTVAVVNPQ